MPAAQRSQLVGFVGEQARGQVRAQGSNTTLPSSPPYTEAVTFPGAPPGFTQISLWGYDGISNASTLDNVQTIDVTIFIPTQVTVDTWTGLIDSLQATVEGQGYTILGYEVDEEPAESVTIPALVTVDLPTGPLTVTIPTQFCFTDLSPDCTNCPLGACVNLGGQTIQSGYFYRLWAMVWIGTGAAFQLRSPGGSANDRMFGVRAKAPFRLYPPLNHSAVRFASDFVAFQLREQGSEGNDRLFGATAPFNLNPPLDESQVRFDVRAQAVIALIVAVLLALPAILPLLSGIVAIFQGKMTPQQAAQVSQSIGIGQNAVPAVSAISTPILLLGGGVILSGIIIAALGQKPPAYPSFSVGGNLGLPGGFSAGGNVGAKP